MSQFNFENAKSVTKVGSKNKTSDPKNARIFDVKYAHRSFKKTIKGVKTDELKTTPRLIFGNGFMESLGLNNPSIGLDRMNDGTNYFYKVVPVAEARYFKGKAGSKKTNFITDVDAEAYLQSQGMIQHGVSNSNLTLVKHETANGTFLTFALKNAGSTPVTENIAETVESEA